MLLMPLPSFAYLDPGSGNALVYLFISLAGACVYFVKGFFYKLLSLVRGKKKSGQSGGSEPSVDKKMARGEKAEVILFSEGPTYWYTFKPLIEELIKRKLPFQYLSLDIRDPGLTIDDPLMRAKFMGFGAGAYARVTRARGKLFLATTPNIGCQGYPLPRPRHIEKMVHISHTVGDITYLKKGSLDHYDVNLDIGPWCEKRMRQVEKNRNLKPKEFEAVGLLYLDELSKHAVVKNGVSEPPVVLLAPSWGDKCCLKIHGRHFVTELLEAGFKVIFRPHPQSFRFDRELLLSVEEENSRFPLFQIDKSIDATAVMRQADVLISDSSSFRFDFAFLQKKPVITLYVPAANLSSFEGGDLGGPWETDVAPKLGAVVQIGELGAKVNLAELIKKLISQPPAGIEALYDELVANHGSAACHIVDWIDRELQVGKHPVTYENH